MPSASVHVCMRNGRGKCDDTHQRQPTRIPQNVRFDLRHCRARRKLNLEEMR
jgi:hypothetical protein